MKNKRDLYPFYFYLFIVIANFKLTAMKTYSDWYEWFKSFSMTALQEIREVICEQGKSEENSLKLTVIDDLMYLKHYGIEL